MSAEVGDTIEQLRAQVEDGREGVIDAHRALLDSADAVIAKVLSWGIALPLVSILGASSSAHACCVPGDILGLGLADSP